jgi:hypothetical protein
MLLSWYSGTAHTGRRNSQIIPSSVISNYLLETVHNLTYPAISRYNICFQHFLAYLPFFMGKKYAYDIMQLSL